MTDSGVTVGGRDVRGFVEALESGQLSRAFQPFVIPKGDDFGLVYNGAGNYVLASDLRAILTPHDSAVPVPPEGDVREALVKLSKWVERCIEAGDFRTYDWACVKCRPNSDMLIDGFQCARHRALSLLTDSAVPPEASTEAVEGDEEAVEDERIAQRLVGYAQGLKDGARIERQQRVEASGQTPVTREPERLGWVIEYEPGKYVEHDGTPCVWTNKAKAEQQTVWQREVENPWSGIRLVPVYFGAQAPSAPSVAP